MFLTRRMHDCQEKTEKNRHSRQLLRRARRLPQTGGTIIRVGRMLIALRSRGELSLVKATPDGIELRSQVRLFTGQQTWATPLIYNKRLYVKGPKELVCFDIAMPANH